MGRVEDFLRLYQSKSTIYSYRWGLTAFFKAIYGENEEKLEEIHREVAQEIQAAVEFAMNSEPARSSNLVEENYYTIT